ncbi:MAG: phosphate/phosphite/phosphonate ABC transporter substrate-binding protein [Myxococcota bacterium]
MRAKRSRLRRWCAWGLVGLALCGCDEPGVLPIELDTNGWVDPRRLGDEPEPAGPLPVRLTLAASSFYSAPAEARLRETMASWFTSRTEIQTEVVTTLASEDAGEALLRGEVDVAQLSPYACIQVAERSDDVALLAASVAQGTTTYASYLVTRADSDVDSLGAARGRKLAFTHPWSASGFLYPWDALRRLGFSPGADFQVSFTGDHDDALDAVLAGIVDVAAVSSDTLVSRNVLGIAGPVRIVAKTGRVPYDCVAARRSLGDRALHRLRRAFFELSILTPEGRSVLRDYGLVNGFVPLPPGHYEPVAALHRAHRADLEALVARIPPPKEAAAPLRPSSKRPRL